MADLQNATTSPTSIRRPSRRAARSGEIDARNRHGEMRSIFCKVAGKPSARSKIPGSLAAARSGSKPLTTGLITSTERPIWRKWPISEAQTKVFPTSVPVPVIKIALIPQQAPKNGHFFAPKLPFASHLLANRSHFVLGLFRAACIAASTLVTASSCRQDVAVLVERNADARVAQPLLRDFGVEAGR